jgi:hypothetical protein
MAGPVRVVQRIGPVLRRLAVGRAGHGGVRPPARRYWLPVENRHVRLRLSARAVKTVDMIGVAAAVARIRARGVKV